MQYRRTRSTDGRRYMAGKGVKHKKKEKAEGGFATIEVTGNLIAPSSSQLFAEIGNLRLYKEVPAEYLKALLS